uniref:Cell adhesion molecule 3 n=1 Tax=Pavo cristatus TaxID=9049 RepID=A0A8C9ENI0_PAVCR
SPPHGAARRLSRNSCPWGRGGYLILLLLLSPEVPTLSSPLLRAVSQPTTSDETVVAGGTVVLKCQVEDPDDSSLQWSNPAQQTLYFGEKRALRDNRIQLERSTPNELTISISDVVLSDEGEYTCSIFTMPVRTAKALVTVLGKQWHPLTSSLCLSSIPHPNPVTHPRHRIIKVGEDPSRPTTNPSSSPAFSPPPPPHRSAVPSVSPSGGGQGLGCQLWGMGQRSHPTAPLPDKPTAKIEPHPQYPREGEKLQLQCDGQGNPVPQEFLWEKEGSDAPLQLSSDSILIFPFLNKSDSGTYICTATSSMGSVIAKYNLDVSDASPVPSTSSTYHAVIGGVVAVIVFLLLSLLIVLGHYLIRHKGTYLTHEAKGSDDAPDADTAIINAEGGQAGGDDKKEYFI